jgi:hypothetical protein
MQSACAMLCVTCGICQTALYYSTLSHENHHFLIKLLDKQFVLLLSTHILSEIFLNLIRTEREMIKKVYWCSCKVLVILVRFN